MKAKQFGVCALVLLLGSAQPVAGSDTGSDDGAPATPAAQPALESLTVSPLQRPPAILAPEQRQPQSPAPLDEADRQAMLEQAAGREVTVRGTMVFNSRTPFIEGKGYLKLSLPLTFHPESPIVFDARYPSRISLHLNVEQGGVYLVDFLVASRSGPGVYRVEGETGSVVSQDADGTLGHVLLALHAAAGGSTSLRLTRDGGNFNLYGVQVTQAE